MRIDYKDYNSELTTGPNGTLGIKSSEKISQSDLLFVTPKSLCSFVKQIWKNNLLDTSVRLLKDSEEESGPTRYYVAIELKSLEEGEKILTWWDWLWTFLFRRTRHVNSKPENHLLLSKYVHPKDQSTVLQAFPLDELKNLNQTYKDTLVALATGFNINYSQLYDVLQQMSNIYDTENEFLTEFINYQPPGPSILDFWKPAAGAVGNAVGNIMAHPAVGAVGGAIGSAYGFAKTALVGK
ncbi:hypothetical protein WDU94_010590 [Cyamophila willieti]